MRLLCSAFKRQSNLALWPCRLLINYILWACTTIAFSTGVAQAQITVSDANSVVTVSVPLNISPSNSTNLVIITGLPADATLSAGTQDVADPTKWTLTPGQLSGLTMTAPTAGVYNLAVSQGTIVNEFTVADNGTFGSGAAPLGAPVPAIDNYFIFENGGDCSSTESLLTPNEYAITQSTNFFNNTNQCGFREKYFTLTDRTTANGYFVFFDAGDVVANPSQIFFEDTITSMTAGADYDLSFYAANVYSGTFGADTLFPNFGFFLDGVKIGETGALPGGMTDWAPFNMTFSTGAAQTTGLFQIILLEDPTSTGVLGADIVMDDFFLTRAATDTATLTVQAPVIVPNPVEVCKWNWYQWVIPNGYVVNDPSNYNPTKFIFGQSETSAGVDTWYATSTAPTSTYSLADQQNPTDSASSSDSERTYGIGYFNMEPNSTKVLTLTDTSKADGHAFAVFDSSGNLIARYPSVSDVSNGQHYVASIGGASLDSEAIVFSTSWSDTLSFTVPADGKVYIHYLNVDENNLTQYISENLDACNVDFGDAPINKYGDPSHNILLGTQLGSAVTSDAAAYDDANASADTDDGVTIPALTQGYSSTLLVEVNQVAANEGYLQAWIDWNGDGDFADVGEQIATDLQSATAGNSTISLPLTVPSDATTNQTFARFRWSTTAGLDSTTSRPDGEVEDYALTIQSYGAPFSCPSGFYQIIGDQLKKLNPATGIYSDVGAAAPFSYNAAGYNPVDGYIYGISRQKNHASEFNLTVVDQTGKVFDLGDITESTSGVVFNEAVNAGDFDDTGNYWVRSGLGLFRINVNTREYIQYAISRSLPVADLVFVNGSLYGANGDILYRVDLSNTTIGTTLPITEIGVLNLPSGGYGAGYSDAGGNLFLSNNAGAIYQILDYDTATPSAAKIVDTIATNSNDGMSCPGAPSPFNFDFSDAPTSGAAPNGSDSNAYGVASHNVVTGIQLGATNDIDSVSITSATNDASGDGSDDDGVTISSLTQGAATVITASVSGAGGYLQGWVDWNGDGDFDDTGEQIATDLQSTGSTISVPVSVPTSATTNQTFARFRWSTTASLDSTSSASDGEVEDYALTIKASYRPTLPPANCSGTYTYWNVDASSNPLYTAGSGEDKGYSHTNAMQVGGWLPAGDGTWVRADMPLPDGSGAISPNTDAGDFNGENGTPIVESVLAVFGMTGTPNQPKTVLIRDDGGYDHQTFAAFDASGNLISPAPVAVNVSVRSGTYSLDVNVPASGEFFIYVWKVDIDQASSTAYAQCAIDFGDAPSTMASIDASLLSTYGEAEHLVYESVSLGALVDSDSSSQSNGLLADGDDVDGSNDDDGVIFDLLGGNRTLRVDSTNVYSVNASVNGFLNAWIDWNQDGDWDDIGEHIEVNKPLVAGSNSLSVVINGMVPQGRTYARFRFTSTSVTAPSPLGFLADGEVEDYAVYLLNPEPIDICDTVVTNGYMENGPFPTGFIQPQEILVDGWATIPVDPDSGNNFAQRNQIEIWKSGFNNVPAFEGDYFIELNSTVPGMLYQDVSLTPGSTYRWKLAHRARVGINTMEVMMGAPDAEVLQATLSTDTTAWKQYSGEYTVPPGEFITRFGFQAVGEGGQGNFLDAISIPGNCDFGDAPDSYGTLKSSNGAYHIANNLLQLGVLVGDPEATGKPSIAADGDDADTDSDEDAISNFGTLFESDRAYSVDVEVTNNTGSTANLAAWIDFDSSGTFDPDEYARALVPSGTTAGTVALNWSAIAPDTVAGDSYLRVRITTDSMGNQSPTGPMSNGEVEDYAIKILESTNVSGRVYVDSNSSASNESGESGIAGTVVVIHDVFTGTCRSAETTGNGDYSFNGVLDGGYEVYQAHGETTPIPQNCGTAFANNPVGYQSTTDDVLFVNVAGADVPDQDFGEVAGTNNPSTGNSGSGITFEPDHQGEVLPGNTTLYAHQFVSEADGGVRFTAVGSGSAVSGWTHTAYRDSDCNGELNGTEGDASINGINLGIAAGSRLCIINKVFAPANVPAQDRYDVTTTATFTFAGSTLAGGANAVENLTVTDITTSGQAVTPAISTAPESGPSRLELIKKVENLSQSTPVQETLNQASPGDVLKYHIYYQNTGTGPITDLEVNDTVPPYTGMISGSATCEETPALMTCAPNVNFDEINWDFTGALLGGEGGRVSYEVLVDD